MTWLILALAVWGGMPGAPADSPVPTSIVVATTRGQIEVPVLMERGHPALSVPRLGQLLPVTAEVIDEWAVVAFADQPFRFLLGASLFVFRGRVVPLVGGAYVARDTLHVPLQWLTEYLPRMFSEGYRYDPYAGRFEEARLAPVAPPVVQPTLSYRSPRAGSAAARNGFRMLHTVVIDAGHGGTDPGNPGRYLPRGVHEKHITLALAKELRDELEKGGVEVVMTRSGDTLVDLRDRARMCREDCSAFVSIHVNSLKPTPGYENISGLETYFLSAARTAEAARVAAMENEAVSYETEKILEEDDPLAFIMKDLHRNEYLRESAQLAEMIQESGARIHPGRDRGVSQAIFTVLSHAERPAVLIETGFATNRQDARFLTSATQRQRLAEAIAAGIITYLRRYEEKVLAGTIP
ncbi:MAG: N-acetylmuramoyl-L-alanine amidase [Gemmatimonadota bacterium]|nr:MAG: N-acetylmuramoyl-L-alanine amidase [Gemmatimonadota bacterium]